MSDKIERISKAIEVGMGNDLRIGQILSNVCYKISEDGTDPFYVNDEKFIEALEKYIGE